MFMRSRSEGGVLTSLLLCIAMAGCGGYGPESPGSYQQVAKAREDAEAGLKGAGAKMELKNYGIGKAWIIDLSGATITDETIDQIVKLPYLSELNVSGTQITDEQLQRVFTDKGFFILKLNVSKTPITDAGIEGVKNLRHLSELDVSGSQVTGDRIDGLGLAAIAGGIARIDEWSRLQNGVDRHDPLAPGLALETGRLDVPLAALRGIPGRQPGGPAPVEHRHRVVPHVAQHPPAAPLPRHHEVEPIAVRVPPDLPLVEQRLHPRCRQPVTCSRHAWNSNPRTDPHYSAWSQEATGMMQT